ncbi:MAG TPA: hypothetical protein VII06_31835 [Chloroflexota bacterium]|jgi:hypothetical protein
MELLILFVGVAALLVLSGSLGYDSRDRLRSAERDLAAWGFRAEPSCSSRRTETMRKTIVALVVLVLLAAVVLVPGAVA